MAHHIFVSTLVWMLIYVPQCVDSYASSMLRRCGTSLSSGTNIMGISARTTSSNSLKVTRGASSLRSGDTYVAGEQLKVTLANVMGEVVYETQGGSFTGAGCSGTRSISTSSTLTMPSSGSVTIWAGYATGYSVVYIVSSVILVSPTLVSPTIVPSKAPTVSPTIVPSKAPTAAKTLVNFPIKQQLSNIPVSTFNTASVKSTFAAVMKQTIVSLLSWQQTPYVSLTNVTSSTVTTTSAAISSIRLLASTLVVSYNVSIILESSAYSTVTVLFTALKTALQSSTVVTNLKLADSSTYSALTSTELVAAGAAAPQVTVLQTAAPTYSPSRAPSVSTTVPLPADSSTDRGLVIEDLNGLTVGLLCGLGGGGFMVWLLTRGVSILTSGSAILGILSVGLVSGWAQSPASAEQSTYLGEPDWSSSSGVLAWHAVLMVGGFFFSQLLALLSWSVFPTRKVGMYSHVMWQTAALATMIAGLAAVYSYKTSTGESRLTTVHGWLGVAATMLFCLSYACGLVMTFSGGRSVDDKASSLTGPHRLLVGSAFVVVAVAASTGIMAHLGRSGCAFVPSSPSAMADYSALPNGCKVANGLGVVLTITTVLAVTAVLYPTGPTLQPPKGSSVVAQAVEDQLPRAGVGAEEANKPGDTMAIVTTAKSMKKLYLRVGSAVCVFLGILSVGLVSGWAQSPASAEQSTYLGEPDWSSSSGVLAWHAVLMVGGFFFSQLLALLSWSVFPTRKVGMYSHVMWQTAALATMIAGLAAVYSYKTSTGESRLTTVHGWLGVAATMLFCLSYACGLLLGGWRACGPLARKLNMRVVHRLLGGSAFVVVAVAASTGIMDQLGRSGCAFVPSSPSAMADYSALPNGCKVANGLGVVLTMATIGAMVIVTVRNAPVTPPTHS